VTRRQLLVVGLMWAAVVAAVPTIRAQHHLFDLRVYDGAVSSWWHGHGLYEFRLGDRELGFTYPPFAALVMSWMVPLPASVLAVVQEVLVLGAVVVALALLLPSLPVLSRWGRWKGAFLLAPPLVLLQPVRDTLSFGQVNTELLALVLVDFALLRRNHRAAGVGAGLAAAIKLTPALFPVAYLVAGRRRAALTGAGTAVAASAAALLVAPHSSWTYWTEVLPDSTRVGSVDSATNQSVAGILARLTQTHPGRAPGTLVVVAVLAVATLLAARRLEQRGDLPAAFALVGLGTCAVSPISWVHHLVWVVPALVVLADRALRTARRGLLVGVVALGAVLSSGAPDLARAKTDHHLDSVWTVLGENAYASAVLVLMVLLVVRTRAEP
jgi:alpha-1,2-mannosyltransferase